MRIYTTEQKFAKKEYLRRWRASNREKNLAYDIKQRIKRKDKRALEIRAWRERNKEHVKKYDEMYAIRKLELTKKRYAANPDKHRDAARKFYHSHKEEISQRLKGKWRKDLESSRKRSREYQRKRRAENPGLFRKKDRENYRRNREKILRRSSAWCKAHPESVRRTKKKWIAKNRERHRTNQQRYESKLRGAAGYHTYQQWMARVKYYGWCCKYCRKELTFRTLEQDHIIPITKGGSNWPANLAPACRSCNASKSNKIIHKNAA